MRHGFQRAVMPRNQTVYDALIVGSGATGGWVAKQLTEQGMLVLMLEAGPPRLPAPYYDKVESFIGVSGSREGLAQMPDGNFLPPMNLSCGGMLARELIGKKFGWVVMPDRMANLTLVHNGRPACHYCDECQRGCYTASYFNSPSVTLPAAARTGRLTLVSDAVVSHVF